MPLQTKRFCSTVTDHEYLHVAEPDDGSANGAAL
jgi:hypothetical protein